MESFVFESISKHTSKIVRHLLEKEKIRVLGWLAQRPELNPIENVWNDVKTKVARKKFKPSWYSIPKE